MSEPHAPDSTTRSSSQKEAATPQFRLPRRLFLKGAGLAALLHTADPAIRYFIEAERRSDVPVYWRFGFHALEEKDGVYLRDHPSVILGETAAWQLDSVLPGASVIESNQKGKLTSFVQAPFEWLRAAGRGSDDALRTHHNILVRTREQGSSMVVTDGDFHTSVSYEMMERELGPLNQAKMALFLSGAGVTTGSLLLLKREMNRKEQMKKNGVPYVPSLPARALIELVRTGTLVYWGDQATRMVTPNRLKPSASISGEMLIEVHNALASLLSDKGGILVDAIGRSADASMALNARVVQELLRQNPDLKEELSPKKSQIPFGIYLYAGGKHEHVKDLYFSPVLFKSGIHFCHGREDRGSTNHVLCSRVENRRRSA